MNAIIIHRNEVEGGGRGSERTQGLSIGLFYFFFFFGYPIFFLVFFLIHVVIIR
jgi:hypothetical protein